MVVSCTQVSLLHSHCNPLQMTTLDYRVHQIPFAELKLVLLDIPVDGKQQQHPVSPRNIHIQLPSALINTSVHVLHDDSDLPPVEHLSLFLQ